MRKYWANTQDHLGFCWRTNLAAEGQSLETVQMPFKCQYNSACARWDPHVLNYKASRPTGVDSFPCERDMDKCEGLYGEWQTRAGTTP